MNDRQQTQGQCPEARRRRVRSGAVCRFEQPGIHQPIRIGHKAPHGRCGAIERRQQRTSVLRLDGNVETRLAFGDDPHKGKTRTTQVAITVRDKEGRTPQQSWLVRSYLAITRQDRRNGYNCRRVSARRLPTQSNYTPYSSFWSSEGQIAPVSGVGRASTTPVSGAMRGALPHLSTPVSGVLSRYAIYPGFAFALDLGFRKLRVKK